MYGYSCVDALDLEIINVQILDDYLKNGKVRLSDNFIVKEAIEESDSIIDTMNKSGFIENLDDEYDERFNYNYSIDDILELLVSDLDAYSLLYKVPPIKISNVEWELLFYELGNYYHNRDIDDFLLDDMIYLNKMAISKAMVYEDDEILLDTYIWSLRYIESDIITENDLKAIALQLSSTFGIDALSLIKNETGKIGCLNKNLEILIDDISDDLIKNSLIENGYKIAEKEDVLSSKPKQKIISFYEYRNGKK